MRKILFFVLILFVFIGCEQKPNSGVESQKPNVEDPESEIDTGIGVENGHEYIDLGLSVKWATCNVGAETPENYGDYFAWAETKSKTTYTLDNYIYSKKEQVTGDYSTWYEHYLTKYVRERDYKDNGFYDNKTELEKKDDAAYVNWGGKWRLPTEAEFNELINFCTWEKTIQNRVAGYRLISNVTGYEGRSIFLPAAGYKSDDELNYTRTRAYYWSSTLDDSSRYALQLEFDLGNEYYRVYEKSRSCGLSIRPVCP